MLGLIRRFGSPIWPDIANHLERTLDIHTITRLLASVNLDRAEEAIFLAQHFHLLGHPDWRVRAGIDGFAVTTNIDLGVGVQAPLTTARTLRG